MYCILNCILNLFKIQNLNYDISKDIYIYKRYIINPTFINFFIFM